MTPGIRLAALCLALAPAPALAGPREDAALAAAQYDGFVAHYEALATKYAGATSGVAERYKAMADHYRSLAAGERAKSVAPAGEDSQAPAPSIYGNAIPRTVITDADVARSGGDLIRAFLDPAGGAAFPENLRAALAEYVRAHPDVVSKYGPRAAPPPADPRPDQPSGQLAAAGGGVPANEPADSFAGSPSVQAAEKSLGGGDGGGGAASLAADKGLAGGAAGRVGSGLSAMSGGLGSTNEGAAGGMPGGQGGASPALRGGAGPSSPSAPANSQPRTSAVPYDAVNQRAAADIKAQVPSARRQALLSDFKTEPANAKFKDLAPVSYAGGSLAHDGDLETFGFTRRCSPPDDCNRYASYPYAPGQLARAETLNRMPTSAEEKAQDKKAGASAKPVEKAKSTERSKIAALWAAIGERIAKARSASAAPAAAPKRSLGGGLSGILARLSARARGDGDRADADLVAAARYAEAAARPAASAASGGGDARPSGPAGAAIKDGLKVGAPVEAAAAAGSPALGLGLVALACAAGLGMIYFWRRRRENA